MDNDLLNIIQELANTYTGGTLSRAVREALIEADLKPSDILERYVTATVWHGTRRKESDEELRQEGFCTYEPKQVEEWLDEALNLIVEKTNPGPRTLKRLQQLKTQIARQAHESWRRQLSVSAFEEDSCGWGFRNPELVHDFLYRAVGDKRELFNEILTELFGEPRKIKITTEVPVSGLLNPQDIHLPVLCIKPKEIVSIEPCHVEAEELSHFPTTGRTRYIDASLIDIKTPDPEEVRLVKARIKTGKMTAIPVVLAKGDRYELYTRRYLGGTYDSIVQAYKELGQKVPVKIARHSSYLP